MADDQRFLRLPDVRQRVTTAWVYDKGLLTFSQTLFVSVAVTAPGVSSRIHDGIFWSSAWHPPAPLWDAYRHGQVTWEDFAHWYRVYLDRWFRWEVWDRILLFWERQAATQLVVVGPVKPEGVSEDVVRCPRRLFVDWLFFSLTASEAGMR